MSITGILLAGGKSSRMGSEKGEIMFNGQKLMEFPLKALESVCDHIMISTCNESLQYSEYQIVCDEIPGLGPIGGIFACLKKSGSEINLVLSYDMPFVSSELLSYLINHSGGFNITAPSLENQLPEPLCSVFHKNTISVIDELIRSKNYKVNDLFRLTSFNHIIINACMPFFNPYLFYNVNKPGEFDNINQLIQSHYNNPGKNHEGDTGE